MHASNAEHRIQRHSVSCRCRCNWRIYLQRSWATKQTQCMWSISNSVAVVLRFNLLLHCNGAMVFYKLPDAINDLLPWTRRQSPQPRTHPLNAFRLMSCQGQFPSDPRTKLSICVMNGEDTQMSNVFAMQFQLFTISWRKWKSHATWTLCADEIPVIHRIRTWKHVSTKWFHSFVHKQNTKTLKITPIVIDSMWWPRAGAEWQKQSSFPPFSMEMAARKNSVGSRWRIPNRNRFRLRHHRAYVECQERLNTATHNHRDNALANIYWNNLLTFNSIQSSGLRRVQFAFNCALPRITHFAWIQTEVVAACCCVRSRPSGICSEFDDVKFDGSDLFNILGRVAPSALELHRMSRCNSIKKCCSCSLDEDGGNVCVKR